MLFGLIWRDALLYFLNLSLCQSLFGVFVLTNFVIYSFAIWSNLIFAEMRVCWFLLLGSLCFDTSTLRSSGWALYKCSSHPERRIESWIASCPSSLSTFGMRFAWFGVARFSISRTSHNVEVGQVFVLDFLVIHPFVKCLKFILAINNMVLSSYFGVASFSYRDSRWLRRTNFDLLDTLADSPIRSTICDTIQTIRYLVLYHYFRTAEPGNISF